MGRIARVDPRGIAVDAPFWFAGLNGSPLATFVPQNQVVRSQSQGFAYVLRMDPFSEGQGDGFRRCRRVRTQHGP